MPRRSRITSTWSLRAPLTRTSPELAETRRFTSFRVVVFPEPLRPSSTSVSPRATRRLTPASTSVPFTRYETSRNSITAIVFPRSSALSIPDFSPKRDAPGATPVLSFAIHAHASDNLGMEKNGSTPVRGEPFARGALVIATLCNPREKFWGMILALAPEGLSLSGAELASFEDLTVMVRDGEPFTPAVVFFPMHRIERVELDLPDGNLPSLSQRFLNKTGLDPATVLIAKPAPGAGETKAQTSNASKEPS